MFISFFVRIELKAVTAKHNLALAKRIFKIMEGPGLVSTLLDPDNNKHLELHPGTINFNSRLEEAQRIHKENMLLASRLDTMQPYYKRSDLKVKNARSNQNVNNKKKKKSQRSKFPEIDDEKGKKNNTKDTKTEPVQEHNPFKVLMEYTKMQNGKILDVAVIKEPFQDRFVIFGIDVDIGQRYELRLTSEEISSILDGDILVTSLDNIEVWVMLLNKISLDPVEVFSKLPSGVFSKRSLEQKFEEKGASEGAPDSLEPRPPSSSRPVDSGPSSRAARRSAGICTNHENNAEDSNGNNNQEGEVTDVVDAGNDDTQTDVSNKEETQTYQLEESSRKPNTMSPYIPVLELSALNSRESGGDLNVKSDDRQQKKASPIGKWDFAPSEEKKAVKPTKDNKLKSTSARSTVNKNENAYGSNKVTLTARPPAEKKVAAKGGRSVTYRKVDEKSPRRGNSKSIDQVKNAKNVEISPQTNGTMNAKISMLSKRVVNTVVNTAVKRQVNATVASASVSERKRTRDSNPKKKRQ